MAWVALLDTAPTPFACSGPVLALAVGCGLVALVAWLAKSSPVRLRKLTPGAAVLIVFAALTVSLLLLAASIVVLEINQINEWHAHQPVCHFPTAFTCYASSIRTGGALYLRVAVAPITNRNVTVIAFACSQSSHPALESLPHNISFADRVFAEVVGGGSGNAVYCTDENGTRISESDSPLGKRYNGKIWIRYVEAGETGNVTKEVVGDFGRGFEP